MPIIHSNLVNTCMQGIQFTSHQYAYLSSDGMSRSGVFITCMSEIERVKVEGGVDIFQTVKAARAQRPHMVYTTVSGLLMATSNLLCEEGTDHS